MVALLWFLFITVIGYFVSIYAMKKYAICNKFEYLIISLLFYAVTMYSFYKTVKLGYGIGIVNIAYSVASILCGLVVGSLIFGEHISDHQKVGATLGIIGCVAMLWQTDNLTH